MIHSVEFRVELLRVITFVNWKTARQSEDTRDVLSLSSDLIHWVSQPIVIGSTYALEVDQNSSRSIKT